MGSFIYLDDILKEHVKNGPAGCGCAVVQNDELLYEGYYGYADLEKKKIITPDTVYRQFSTTKVIICTAAMMLYERGRFLMDDPLYEYFPEWKDTMVADTGEDGGIYIRAAKRPIQIRDCFSMAMGIGYGGEDYTHQMMEKVRRNLAETVGDYTLRQDIYAMSQVPVRFDPGTHFLYGFGHELVAGLIEVVSGKKVSDFLQSELFEPLEMNSTGYRYFGDIRERMVTPYSRREDGSMIPVKGMFDHRHEPDAKYEAGGAGLFSTVRDYLNFSQMMACGGVYKGRNIIGRKTIDLMRTNQLNEQQLKDFSGSYLAGYGYGYGVRTMLSPGSGSNTSVGEFGWTGYMGTYIAIDPSEKAAVVYMHNLEPNMEEYTHHRVRNMAFGALK